MRGKTYWLIAVEGEEMFSQANTKAGVRADETGAFGSWSLNGNHDVYSGGHAYFDVLLRDPRVARQEQSSFFSFVNK
jgi:hypothetical protein